MTGLGNAPSFDIVHFQAIAGLIPADLQIWLFWAFFLGFAIKVPMFPFHTWLPDAHVEAPTAGSVILAGVLLKMGTYGFLRFSLPICPDASRTSWVQFAVVVLSIIGIIYGSMVAMVQKDMKKLVAYSSVAHLGFFMLGLFALNNAGIQGGILQMINHGLSTGALFLLVGIVYERTHTRMIADYGGLSGVMPVYAMLFMVILLASIGLPLLNGFVGEFTILTGAFLADWRWAAWASLGVVLGAAYMLWLYQRVFFGELTNEKNKGLKDVNLREILDARAAHRHVLLDRPLPEAVLRDDGSVRREDRPRGQPASALGIRAADGVRRSGGSRAGRPRRRRDRSEVSDAVRRRRHAPHPAGAVPHGGGTRAAPRRDGRRPREGTAGRARRDRLPRRDRPAPGRLGLHREGPAAVGVRRDVRPRPLQPLLQGPHAPRGRA